MSILSVIALFGAGYMYRDYSQYKTWRRPVNYNYGGYSYNRPQTIKQYLKNVAMDKMDVIFYGTKPKKEGESASVTNDKYYERVQKGLKNYISHEIDQDKYYDDSSAEYEKETIYAFADHFEDSFGDRINSETVESYIGPTLMWKIAELDKGGSMYVRNKDKKIDYEIIVDEKYCG